MSDLFPDCKMDSPRLAWMKKYEITVIHDPNIIEMQEDEFGNEYGAYCVCSYKLHGPTAAIRGGSGMTLEDALSQWAYQNGIALWNEEAYMKEHK